MLPVVHELIPLQLMRSGQTAQVAEVFGDSEHIHRLNELGLRRGAKVQMVQPGAPCIIRLDGSKLCLRHDDLASVLVTPL